MSEESIPAVVVGSMKLERLDIPGLDRHVLRLDGEYTTREQVLERIGEVIGHPVMYAERTAEKKKKASTTDDAAITEACMRWREAGSPDVFDPAWLLDQDGVGKPTALRCLRKMEERGIIGGLDEDALTAEVLPQPPGVNW